VASLDPRRLWDHYPHVGRDGRKAPPADRPSLRTAPFDRALQDQTNDDDDELPPSDDELHRLGRVARARRRAFILKTLGRDKRSRSSHATLSATSTPVVISVAVAFLVVAPSAGFTLSSALVVALFALILYAAGAVLVRFVRFLTGTYTPTDQRRTDHAAAIVKLACPACDYPLEPTPAFPPERTAGCNLGPSTCPECGLRWPLIPPSTRNDPSETDSSESEPPDSHPPPPEAPNAGRS